MRPLAPRTKYAKYTVEIWRACGLWQVSVNGEAPRGFRLKALASAHAAFRVGQRRRRWGHT